MGPFAIIALVSAIASTGMQIKGQKDQAEAQEEANEVASAQETIDDLNTKRKSVKEARVARARLQQQANATGTSGSSGEQGALAGLQTQLGAGMARMDGQANTANALTNINQTLADKNMFTQTMGALAGGIGSAASSFQQASVANSEIERNKAALNKMNQ
tara:strand:+ start:89 stop:568 length:480 start_codon:yes stop_codon:yes gene_type:complete